jgi:hypothetical protein
MLRSIEELERYALQASDGEVGQLRDLFFDDASWAIRYLVVETGAWLSSRKVLVSPAAVGLPVWNRKSLPVAMTLAQVKSGATTYTENPVPRQRKIGFIGFPGYPYRTAGPGSWSDDADRSPAPQESAGFVARPLNVHHRRREEAPGSRPRVQRKADLHLRSCNGVRNWYVCGNDGEIGSVQGMLVDEEAWVMRYLVVKAGAWWPEHELLIACPWIRYVNWFDASIRVDLTRKQLQESPPYEADKALNREGETRLFRHYGRRSYWADEAIAPPVLARD